MSKAYVAVEQPCVAVVRDAHGQCPSRVRTSVPDKQSAPTELLNQARNRGAFSVTKIRLKAHCQHTPQVRMVTQRNEPVAALRTKPVWKNNFNSTDAGKEMSVSGRPGSIKNYLAGLPPLLVAVRISVTDRGKRGIAPGGF